MKAVVLNEFGPPSVLRVEDVPTPEPGPDEAVIKVQAVSVNRTLDLVVRAGRYARKPPLPHILGVDPAGVISAVGLSVTDRRPGDRVIARSIMGVDARGEYRQLGISEWGGYAEYVKVPARVTHVIPDTMDFPTAVVVARHGPLAFAQLLDYAAIMPGEWVLVMGAAGGLGSAAVQVARHLGAHVIAGAGSDERVAAALALGADVGINYRTQDLTAEVMRTTNGEGVNVVLENIGDPDLFAKAFAAIAVRGRLVTAGGHGGGIVPLDVNRLYQRKIAVIGAPVASNENLAMSLRAAAEGRLKVMIDRVLPLGQAARAHELVEARTGIGKVLLDPTRID